MNPLRKRSQKRDVILSALQARPDHPTAEMLFRDVKATIPEISLGTVYRNLAVLEQQKLVLSAGQVDGQERYETRTDPHAHFICRECRRMFDLEWSSALQDILQDARENLSCTPESCTLTVTGLCADCSRWSSAQTPGGDQNRSTNNDIESEAITMKKWICSVCGHVHEGIAPPELCPVCKVTSSHFHTQEEIAEARANAGKTFPDDIPAERLKAAIDGTDAVKDRPVKKWVCSVCGHVHEGTTPPELCPICKVTASHFHTQEEMAEARANAGKTFPDDIPA
ncbi:MAG: transcriptional repressor, partial [Oscillospiraceae bacterium]|nr:transcriptional repressor [Oscillospiraceae bacterium]